MMEQVYIIVTTESSQEARQIVYAVLEAGLAAGVNVLPFAETFYREQGTIQEAAELFLIFRTVQAQAQAITEKVMAINPEREVTLWPVTQLNPRYAQWVVGELRMKDEAL